MLKYGELPRLFRKSGTIVVAVLPDQLPYQITEKFTPLELVITGPPWETNWPAAPAAAWAPSRCVTASESARTAKPLPLGTIWAPSAGRTVPAVATVAARARVVKALMAPKRIAFCIGYPDCFIELDG